MNKKLISYLTVALATVSLFFTACEDDMSGIGNSISNSEVVINVDSLTYNLKASTVAAPTFESRSLYNLLGSIRVPEYGALDCSYVTQFLPAEQLNLPDTITSAQIDSVKMIFEVPKKYISGDTLAPLQLKVYSLEKQLPSDIASNFNPEGYYNPDPISTKSYTLSGYSFNDSTFTRTNIVEIKTAMPLELGRKVVDAYSSNPDIFVWPEEFAKYWPGVYVAPSFGKGCIAPISRTSIYAYFPQTKVSTEKDEDGESQLVYKQVADSVCLFTTAPEVLSSVNITYTPSDNLKEMVSEGKSIITTPGGYVVSFKFPAVDILEDYWSEDYDLGVINNMVFSIPAKIVPNSYGLGLAPSLLLIKTSEMESFFTEGRLPDNVSSFSSLYSSEDNAFVFSSMRQYIVDLRAKGKENITDEDLDFTLIPVALTTEDYTDTSTGALVTAVTSVTSYIMMPTMAELDTEHAIIVFTYSNQLLE